MVVFAWSKVIKIKFPRDKGILSSQKHSYWLWAEIESYLLVPETYTALLKRLGVKHGDHIYIYRVSKLRIRGVGLPLLAYVQGASIY